MMIKARKNVFYLLLFSGLIVLLILIMQPLEILQFQDKIAILFPKGIIAHQESRLLFVIQAIMLLVIIPVYILTFVFSWKYRAHNPEGTYDPDLVDHRLAEYLWWGIPLVFTLIIAVLTWVKTYELDPFRPLSNEKPLTIQVVALPWRWLFIYPEENIATVNFFQIPKDKPIRFEVTADAPMNSFWIPYLGGQIYAMPKMKTELNIVANDVGDFRGSSANISGEGFADMHFITRASSEEEYQKWIATTKQSTDSLDFQTYQDLAKPRRDTTVMSFQLKDNDLFHKIIMKYMHPHKEE